MSDEDLGRQVEERARMLGFDAVGFARADVPLDIEHERYKEFLDQGMHGTMGYLAEHHEVRRRLDTDAILPGAKTVICLARRYQRSGGSEAADPPLAQRIARYARGHDYHNGVRRKLRRLAAYVRTLGTAESPAHARPMCDDVPVLERAWAARSGLGFIGKNGLLIVPGEGSFVLLGEVVTTLELPPGTPMAERCGTCTRCLDACPTKAFARPFVLDPRLCVAYLTIELRGPIPEAQRAGVGEHLFGCDDCQTVCPFNLGKRQGSTDPRTATFEPLPLWSRTSEEELLAMDETTWDGASLGSPVKRAELAGIARNAAVVLGNRGDARSRPALERAAGEHTIEAVREAAGWALGRLNGHDLDPDHDRDHDRDHDLDLALDHDLAHELDHDLDLDRSTGRAVTSELPAEASDLPAIDATLATDRMDLP
jgi:epoxyqueuosine reductase